MGMYIRSERARPTYVHQTAMYRNRVAVLEERNTVGKTREGITCESRGNHFTETVVTLPPKVETWHEGEGNSVRSTIVHWELPRMAT